MNEWDKFAYKGRMRSKAAIFRERVNQADNGYWRWANRMNKFQVLSARLSLSPGSALDDHVFWYRRLRADRRWPGNHTNFIPGLFKPYHEGYDSRYKPYA